MKIVITDADTVTFGNVSLDFFSKFGELEIFGWTTPEELSGRIKNADIVLCNKTQITVDAMKTAKNLKFIGLFATGYNNIDVEYANSHDITVCNVPGYSTEGVAQHTIALMLAVVNQIGKYDEILKTGDWQTIREFKNFPLPLMELNGKTLGIIGYGAIARRVADIAKAFNMRVLAVNRSKVSDTTVTQVSLDYLLSNSDIISLHCPLNEDSKGMINKEAFQKMKQGAILINTARGPIVDEQALCDALNSGKLAGAGIDVLSREPIDRDCPLYNAKNCIITPHIAWASMETRLRLFDVVRQNIEAFLNGTPQNAVN
jgi:glycerate dehydrogenase